MASQIQGCFFSSFPSLSSNFLCVIALSNKGDQAKRGEQRKKANHGKESNNSMNGKEKKEKTRAVDDDEQT